MTPLAAIALALALRPVWADGPMERSIPKPAFDKKLFVSGREYLLTMKAVGYANEASYEHAFQLFTQAEAVPGGGASYFWQGLAHERLIREKVRQWWIQWARESSRAVSGPALEGAVIAQQAAAGAEAYAKALEIFPQNQAFHFKLGELLLNETDRLTEAQQHLERALRLVPSDPKARKAYAEAQIAAKKFDEAAELADVLASHPEKPARATAHDLLGRIELERKNFTKALSEFQRALDIHSKSLRPFHGLAQAYVGLKRHDEALKAYRKFLKMEPSNLKEVRLLEEARSESQRLSRYLEGR